MSDKHKAHKKDATAEHGKRDEAQKSKDKPVKPAARDDDMPGAEGFISARADEDTYD
ncbi:MAG: hypothetical protein JNK01_01435 [Devosia sp.]|jgi:hypothetical protein|nr:hypothetical protein [Devosia sp.]